MKFSVSKLAAAFLFVSVASANLHDSCTCHNSDSYNWRITTKACQLYARSNYQWGQAAYDTPSGRCVAASGAQIAGDQWEDACRQIAKSGFDCADGRGHCTADPDAIKGWC
ncbi:hypothetical protein LZ31DRAFT_580020 [Colletotrichum somersetense]|nr:hypothetical protein LZ31DRAFT_580020 [Colletotrichum somersetense]